MNVLQFHQKISSQNNEQVDQFYKATMLFNMINGSALKEEELVQIVNKGNKFEIDFVSEQCAYNAANKLAAQIVPGVYGSPLYGIMAQKQNASLIIRFVEL